MIRATLATALLLPASVHADDGARPSLAPYDVGRANIFEWRTALGFRQLQFADQTEHDDSAVTLGVRWWPAAGSFLGLRQPARFRAPVAYADERDPAPEPASGLDDLHVEAGLLRRRGAMTFGLRLDARLPTSANDLSRNQVGGEVMPVIAIDLPSHATIALLPSLVLRPASPSGRTDEAAVRLGAAISIGYALRMIATGHLEQGYAALRGERTGPLAQDASILVAYVGSSMALGVKVTGRRDEDAPIQGAREVSLFVQLMAR